MTAQATATPTDAYAADRQDYLPCAYTDLATCPLPPAQHRLPVAIEAGEQIPYERR
ncbi:DUF1684 domain-containing protein [Nocardia asteroides]|nr:DUF1684 domain-containing protein [Nocardia asteroides]